jgi:hypothetical protein
MKHELELTLDSSPHETKMTPVALCMTACSTAAAPKFCKQKTMLSPQTTNSMMLPDDSRPQSLLHLNSYVARARALGV